VPVELATKSSHKVGAHSTTQLEAPNYTMKLLKHQARLKNDLLGFPRKPRVTSSTKESRGNSNFFDQSVDLSLLLRFPKRGKDFLAIEEIH
jgi:hypothetical protein